MSKTITLPGAVDVHVHFREPGTNKSETIETGSRAALRGGFALVCDMPNNPGKPTWSLKRLQQKQKIARQKAYMPMATYAGAQPESNNLDELIKMAPHSIGLKLYGGVTTGSNRDYEAREFADIVKTWHRAAPAKPIMLHAGNHNLKQFIDLIAKQTNHRLHVCHVSSPAEVESVLRAKRRGLAITCGVCPHHLFKNSSAEKTEGWFVKMMPPLATQIESEALWNQLVRGNIDVVESDHAPHKLEDKWRAETEKSACYGVPGIEFVLPLLFYQMVKGRISLKWIVQVTSSAPAKIIGVKLSSKTKVTWKMDIYRIGDEFPKGLSGSGWTPYLNNLAVGRVIEAKIAGQSLVKGGKIVSKHPQLINQRGQLL